MRSISALRSSSAGATVELQAEDGVDAAHAPARPLRQALRARDARRLRRLVAVPLRVGIVGLPNSGKTTLFNALTHAGAQVTAYTEVTQKPNVGMAVIADDRLDRLAQVVGSKKVTPAAIRVVDVPGPRGDSWRASAGRRAARGARRLLRGRRPGGRPRDASARADRRRPRARRSPARARAQGGEVGRSGEAPGG